MLKTKKTDFNGCDKLILDSFRTLFVKTLLKIESIIL